MLILKQNAANTVPTPPAGKGTIFLDDSDTLSVKTSAGNVETFPTVAASNSQVVFMNGTSLSGEAAFTYDFNNNVLSVSGNVAATRVLTDNLLYANGTAWDLQQPGGSNTQVQFNDADSFGGSANYVFNKTTNNLTVTGNIIDSGGAFYGNGAGLTSIPGANVSGAVPTATAATTAGTVTTAAQPNITSVGTLSGLTVSSTITGSVSGSAGTAGTVTTAAQPNITSVGTLTSLSVTGNANVGNIGATQGVFTNVSGNGSALSSITGANVTGAVAFATTANAVAGANVSGEVGFAAVANSVAGANVSGQVANALVAGTVYTAAQPNITSVGTLTSLAVTGNVTAGNLSGANLVSANFVTGTLTTAAQPNITSVGTLTGLSVDGSNITLANGVFAGNGSGLFSIAGANVTGTVSSATTAGTVTTAAQPNITSVGTLSSLAVTGNGTFGNVYANSGTVGASLLTGTLTTAAQPNVTSVGTLTSVTVTGNVAAGNLTTTGILSVTGTGTSSIAGNLDMTSNTIINLANPTNDQDAATKIYVDNIAQGLHVHAPSAAATPDTLANISGGTVTYNNGTSGVGATLTTTGTYTTIDTINIANVGTRILVKNEANAAHNGIYTYTSSTVLTRATDFDTPTEMAGGDFTFVSGGATYNDTGWVMPDPVTTVGTSAVTFVQFSGAGTYTAGTGLTLTGSVFSVNASQTQVTSLGNVTTGTWNSLVGASATFAAGLSGANLASITGANVTGTVPAATVAGTVTTAAQPNITSVGTLTSLAVTGNITAGNVSATTFTGSLSGAATSATTAGTVTTAAQPNITSVGTLTSLAVTGNITAGNVSATTFTGSLSGAATTAGTVTTAAQGNITSVGTLTGLGVNGTVTAVNITANTGVFTGNGSALTALNGSNISTGTIAQARLANSSLTVNGTSISLGGSGTITATATNTLTLGSYLTGTSYNGSSAVTAAVDATTTNTASKVVARDGSGNFAAGTITATLSGAATTAGTVTTAAQPNITSVGTLTSLSVSGGITNANITTGANTTAGSLTGNWTLTAGSRLQATYADLAEKYVSDASYPAGTVLLFGGDYEVTISNATDSHSVAGVVSTNPAYIMNSGCQGEHVVDLALQGRVPVKVQGHVRKGDLMVSGLNGHAVANNMARAGTIIGKALQNFSGDHGVIEIVVGRV